VTLRPRDAAGLLGRERELEVALAALAGGFDVEFHGPPGAGKTSLLRRLSHRGAGALPHGIVFLRAAGQPRADVEQFLFDALYETSPPCKPTPAELRIHLGDRRALVVLDDLDALDRDDVSALLDSLPQSRFVLAARERRLWGSGRSEALAGLPLAAALALLEQALERPLQEQERARATELCGLLGGRPLALLQAAALARSEELPSEDAAQLERELQARLAEPERRAQRVLELLAPAAVHVDDVAAIAELPDAPAVLERLRAAGAAQAHSPRWSTTLTGTTQPEVAELAATPGIRAGAAAAGGTDDALLLARVRQRFADGGTRPAEDVPVVLAALHRGLTAQLWAEVVALVRTADPLLILSRRWGAWGTALEGALAAARAALDRPAEAWALHQLGTRAGCLGDVESGIALLGEAVALRHTLGDERGAALSEHNATVLRGGGGVAGNGGPHPPRGPSMTRVLAIGLAALAAGAGLAALLTSGSDSASQPVAPLSTGSSSTTAPATTVPSPTTAPSSTTAPTTTTSTGPALTPSTTRLGFDSPDVGRTERQQLTVTNTGTQPIAVVPSSSSAAFSVSAGGCASPLPVGATCAVLVAFQARSTGQTTGTLSFAGTSAQVALTGTVTVPRPPPTTTIPPTTTPPPTPPPSSGPG
jgi:MoxR-like ATPase